MDSHSRIAVMNVCMHCHTDTMNPASRTPTDTHKYMHMYTHAHTKTESHRLFYKILLHFGAEEVIRVL